MISGEEERDLSQLAVEAYVFLYPLVNMDVWPPQSTNIESGQRVPFGGGCPARRGTSGGDPVSELSQLGEAATSGAAVAIGV